MIKSPILSQRSSCTALQAAEVIGANIPVIPLLLGSIVLVFGVFNINNDVDLTDAGRAKTRAAKKAAGPSPIEKSECLKPII